jgi:hypothetical protein
MQRGRWRLLGLALDPSMLSHRKLRVWSEMLLS